MPIVLAFTDVGIENLIELDRADKMIEYAQCAAGYERRYWHIASSRGMHQFGRCRGEADMRPKFAKTRTSGR